MRFALRILLATVAFLATACRFVDQPPLGTPENVGTRNRVSSLLRLERQDGRGAGICTEALHTFMNVKNRAAASWGQANTTDILLLHDALAMSAGLVSRCSTDEETGVRFASENVDVRQVVYVVQDARAFAVATNQ
ncbi:MAG: hypothetical protein JWL80_325 [Parcubacteria group bacterium]|nr:hypothetical protein [Parcubacteria group bacterium]